MSWLKTMLFGLVAGLLSTSACIIYLYIYKVSFMVDYSKVIGPMNILISCFLACQLMSISYRFVLKYRNVQIIGVLNTILAVVSFASIAGVFAFNLPLDTEFPELFPGMVIPMHFFPLLSLLTIFPFFNSTTNDND